MKQILGGLAAAAMAFTVAASDANAFIKGDYQGDVLLRVGIAGVLPDSSFSPILVDGNVAFGSDSLEVDDAWVPDLTIT